VTAFTFARTDQDIGTGGFDGFSEYPKGLRDHSYGFAGGHSNMLVPECVRPSRQRQQNVA
jgi:hypothetical protein